MRILLIAGGWSNEREVSLSGAAQIEKALSRLGHQVTPFDPLPGFDGLIETAKDHDFAFLNLHGSPGEDGLIQAMLDAAGVPYQGSGPKASFLALHKAATKQICRAEGIPTPNWAFVPVVPAAGWLCPLAYPLFVKPNNGGSSVDMQRVDSAEKLGPALDALFSKGKEALLEEAAPGFEMTCAVLGEEALPTILITPKLSGEFFDYRSKYEDGGADEICPAPVDDDLNARVRELALRAHLALGCEGYSRSDFIVTESGPVLLETNTLPGMTATSLVPKAAAAAGMSFDELIARLIELGLARSARRQRAQAAAEDVTDIFADEDI
ncbi:D-alanine--D-alanine ligase [Desulfovibrio sp. X2]|uniref:D-alanine--D-alanine ligase family protein n=1 Tax=Desulfovibrio sp. X2 TaxID=941449 RepID=UPI000358A472|nr:D-alanine--D-alanine ligase [Desulfovibrio sp. X2]EPR42425.1 D-alanine--D-alanine ligase [Desulfovibrio sp. X2]